MTDLGGKQKEGDHVVALPKRAPETIRTSDRWYRKPVLYPLSYGGIRKAV